MYKYNSGRHMNWEDKIEMLVQIYSRILQYIYVCACIQRYKYNGMICLRG